MPSYCSTMAQMLRTPIPCPGLFAAAFLLSGSFPVPVVKADQPQDKVITEQDSAAAASSGSVTEMSEEAEEISSSSSAAEIREETEAAPSSASAVETDENTDIPSSGPDADEREDAEPSASATEITERTETAEDTEGTLPSEPVADEPLPDKPPAFHAHIKYQMGYTVIGTFADFTPDIVRVDTLYSLDGESWRAVTGGDWNLDQISNKTGFLRYPDRKTLSFLPAHCSPHRLVPLSWMNR